MNSRLLAAALGALMIVAPIAAATHGKEQGPPESVFAWIGGAQASVVLNLAPQEVSASGAVLDPTATDQRLETTGTYDCTTGKPATGANAHKYSMDAVILNALGTSLGLNDHSLTGTLPGSPSQPSKFIYYGATPYLAYGSAQPANINPGLILFYVHVFCGGNAVKTLPEALPGQTAGIIGFHDENEWQPVGGSRQAYGPEFYFDYREAGANSNAGTVAGGAVHDVHLTSGWYMTNQLIWTPDTNLQGNTFRFVVNPSLTTEFPGYAGSLSSGLERECLVNGEAGEDGGAFGNCANEGIRFKGVQGVLGQTTINSHYFNEEPASETPTQPAPAMEDVDVYGAPDSALFGESVLTSAFLEVVAAENEANRVFPYIQTSKFREMEPQVAGEESVKPFGGPWSYYFDVQKIYSVPEVATSNVDPLYNLDLTERRDVYPGFVRFTALLGLARDYNGDGFIFSNWTLEWFPIGDRLSTGTTTALEDIGNWGDVGSAFEEGGNDLIASEQTVSYERCITADPRVAVHPAGTPAPMGVERIADCRPFGNATAGWGTFGGARSSTGGTTQAYGGGVDILVPSGSSQTEVVTKVKARVVWPSLADWQKSGLSLPAEAGVTYSDLLASTPVVYLQDIDVYGPTVS